MDDSFLLDTSAFITLADREPGFERVQSLLEAGKRGEVEPHASFVTLTEVRYVLTYDRGAGEAARICAVLRRFPVQWHHSDDALCDEAAKLKAAHKISFADAFVAATAKARRPGKGSTVRSRVPRTLVFAAGWPESWNRCRLPVLSSPFVLCGHDPRGSPACARAGGRPVHLPAHPKPEQLPRIATDLVELLPPGLERI